MKLLLDTHVVLWWLDDPSQLSEVARAAIHAARFEPLSVTISHAFGIESLPSHHRDPFDRLLVAQAIHEKCTLVSRDSQQQKYPVPFLMA